MQSARFFAVAIFLVLFVNLCVPPSVSGFVFSQPEIRLIEEAWLTTYQNDVDAVFDLNNNLHAVWSDNRDSTVKIYGNTVLTTRIPIGSYISYQGSPTVPDVFPNIMSNSFFPYEMHVLGASLTDPDQIVGATYDLMLPGTVGATDDSATLLLPAGFEVDGFESIWIEDRISFVFEYDFTIYYGQYLPGIESWTLLGSIPRFPDEQFVSPSLASDEEGYIYLCYNRIDMLSFTSTLVARRSVIPANLESGWEAERGIVQVANMNGFIAAIDATGSAASVNLHVAVAFSNQSAPSPLVTCIVDHNGNWFIDNGFNGASNDLNSITGDYIGGIDIAFDPIGRIYVVWTDDRVPMLFQLYGNISFDFGESFGPDRLIDTAGWEVLEQPCLAMGYTPGTLAVTYIHREGSDPHHPYALVSFSEFYDSCDNPPAMFWDGYGGVLQDMTLFHGNTGLGTSYRLQTGGLKGQLIRDYGVVEQQGAVELYFYDSMTDQADFSVVLNNDNLKGVIRMLGVRNDTTQNNYSYYDGSDWVIWGGPRTIGWHHVIVTVNDVGIHMELETAPGTYLSYADAIFTSFTSIVIEGGSDTDPYHVDDIRVETIPLETVLPLPVDSTGSILLCVMILTVFWLRLRR